MVGLQGACPEIVLDGQSTTLLDKSAFIDQDEAKAFDYVSDGKRHWFRVSARSEDGSLLVVTNPIYLNF
jgi:hypothetical protein